MNPLVPISIAAALGTGLFLYEKKKLPGQTPAKSSGSGFQTASFAQSSMSVKDVQAALNNLGASPPLAVDGQAGPATTAAIKSFQTQAGITVDGVVGPQTVAALQHATNISTVAGLYDLDELAEEAEMEGSPSMVAGPWFMEHDLYEGGHGAGDLEGHEEEIEHVGQSMVHLSGVNRRAASARGYNVVGQRGGGSSRGGAQRSAPSQGLGARQGYDDSSNNWCSPDVAQIMADPLQQQQIGINELWRAKAEAAFGPGTSAGYDYSFLPDQGAGALNLVTQELGGSSLGGVNFASGEYDEDLEPEEAFVGQLMGEEEEGAFVGAGYDIDESEIEETYVGQGCWSAPDINEALRDPEQVGEMMTHQYGLGLPYPMMQPQPQNQPIWGYPSGYGNMPVNYQTQAPGAYPAGYPYGPMNAPISMVQPAPTLGGVQINPATAVPGQGYQFQSQQGRFF